MSKQGLHTIICVTGALVVAASAGAQTRAHHAAKKSASALPKTVAPAPPPTISVVVFPVDSVGGDSIRVMVQRDLDNGDRVVPAFLDPAIIAASSPIGSDSINFALLKPSGASTAIRFRRTESGVKVVAFDIGTGMVRQSFEFPLPVVGGDRSGAIRDSLSRDLDSRSAFATATLTRDSFVRDSLLRAAAAPPPKKRQNTKERAAARLVQAQRDSTIKEIELRRVAILDRSRRDTVERDSVLPLLLSADSASRDHANRALRAAIHGISDEIERWLTGTPGIASTRIAYVQGSHLHVIDSDGAYDDVMSTPGAALSPAWHPSGRSLVYSDFNDAGTQIGEVELDTRHGRLLAATKRGLNITPVYTPDGKSIVYASGGETPADLVIADADGATPARKLDFSVYENSSPSFSPDGARLVFMSPRPALTPQLFTMNADGTKLKQLTPSVAGRRSYRTGPDWSPSGDAVAFEQQNGDFQVWMISLKSGKMRQLTSVAENEDPSWAPDGRHMAITSTRSGDRQIWVLDVPSGRYRQLTRSPGARLSAWGPVIRREPVVTAAVAGGNR